MSATKTASKTVKSAVVVTRGSFGEITDSTVTSEGRTLILEAIAAGKLPAEYFDRKSRNNAEALNYDVYDRIGAEWLIQQRITTIDKWGNHPTKYYFLVRRVGRGIVVTEVLAKAKATRVSKTAAHLGDAIRVLRGEAKIPTARRTTEEPAIYFKAVALVDGEMQSIYDCNTVYTLGKSLTERVEPNHGGGYYVYETEAEARACEVPACSDNRTAPRAILKVACSGRSVRYGNGKIAFTRVRPLEIIAENFAY